MKLSELYARTLQLPSHATADLDKDRHELLDEFLRNKAQTPPAHDEVVHWTAFKSWAAKYLESNPASFSSHDINTIFPPLPVPCSSSESNAIHWSINYPLPLKYAAEALPSFNDFLVHLQTINAQQQAAAPVISSPAANFPPKDIDLSTSPGKASSASPAPRAPSQTSVGAQLASDEQGYEGDASASSAGASADLAPHAPAKDDDNAIEDDLDQVDHDALAGIGERLAGIQSSIAALKTEAVAREHAAEAERQQAAAYAKIGPSNSATAKIVSPAFGHQQAALARQPFNLHRDPARAIPAASNAVPAPCVATIPVAAIPPVTETQRQQICQPLVDYNAAWLGKWRHHRSDCDALLHSLQNTSDLTKMKDLLAAEKEAHKEDQKGYYREVSKALVVVEQELAKHQPVQTINMPRQFRR